MEQSFCPEIFCPITYLTKNCVTKDEQPDELSPHQSETCPAESQAAAQCGELSSSSTSARTLKFFPVALGQNPAAHRGSDAALRPGSSRREHDWQLLNIDNKYSLSARHTAASERLTNGLSNAEPQLKAIRSKSRGGTRGRV